MLMTRSAVSTEYRRATGGQTKGQTACHGIVRAMHMRRAVKIVIFDRYLALSRK